MRILNHVSLVESIDNNGPGLPQQPYLRAKIIVDLTRPLIPGCFLPIDGDRVSWVYFRYEGIFKFWKECGCVGHNTCRCHLSADDARRRRDESSTNTREYSTIYTNIVRGLSERFVHHNPRINLYNIFPHLNAPPI